MLIRPAVLDVNSQILLELKLAGGADRGFKWAWVCVLRHKAGKFKDVQTESLTNVLVQVYTTGTVTQQYC